jgi:hypothetical protein
MEILKGPGWGTGIQLPKGPIPWFRRERCTLSSAMEQGQAIGRPHRPKKENSGKSIFLKGSVATGWPGHTPGAAKAPFQAELDHTV